MSLSRTGALPPLKTEKSGFLYVSKHSESKRNFDSDFRKKKLRKFFEFFFFEKIISEKLIVDFFMGLEGVLKHFFFYGP